MKRFYDENLNQHKRDNRTIKSRSLSLLSLLFMLFILLLILLNSCNRYHSKLPAHDLIIKLKVANDEITAESAHYLYRFTQKTVTGGQDRQRYISDYDNFMQQYQKYVERRAVLFKIFEKHVDASYQLLVNLALMSQQDLEDLNIDNRNLKNRYLIEKTADKNKIIVQFSTPYRGEYFSKQQHNNSLNLLDDNHLLTIPIPVTIDDITYRRSIVEDFYGGAIMTLETMFN